MTALRDTLQGTLILAPMTRGSNLPYQRLCQELGASVTMSEMTVARRLKQKRRGEFTLIRRAPDERFFGVQLAGNKPDEMAWAAELVVSRGADRVDVEPRGAQSITSPARASVRRSHANPSGSAGSSSAMKKAVTVP